MKFYDCRTAPSPRRVRIFIAEKGIDVPTVEIDLRGGAQFAEDFRRLNPFATVPILELDDGTAITESPSICRYLEEVHPEPPLFGRDARERAVVDMWDRRIELTGIQAVMEAFRNTAPGFKDRALTGPAPVAQIPELAARGRARIDRFLDMLDRQLAGNDYVAGDTFSIADITGLVTVDFATRAARAELGGRPNLQAWHARVSARPSARL